MSRYNKEQLQCLKNIDINMMEILEILKDIRNMLDKSDGSKSEPGIIPLTQLDDDVEGYIGKLQQSIYEIAGVPKAFFSSSKTSMPPENKKTSATTVKIPEWSEPKFKCPKCGGGMRENNFAIIMSIPPEHKFVCQDCGYIEHHIEPLMQAD